MFLQVYVCKYGRQFNNKRQLDLLQQQKYNPKLFWKKFSQLGGSGFPSGLTVPDLIINNQGQEASDKKVLNTWRSHFSNLLNAGTIPHLFHSPPVTQTMILHV